MVTAVSGVLSCSSTAACATIPGADGLSPPSGELRWARDSSIRTKVALRQRPFIDGRPRESWRTVDPLTSFSCFVAARVLWAPACEDAGSHPPSHTRSSSRSHCRMATQHGLAS